MAKQIVQEFFGYPLNFAALLHGGASVIGNITMDSDADFILIKTMMDARTASAETNQATPYGTVTIQDTASGRNWMSAALALTTFFGNAQNPFILPQSKRIAANSNVQVTLANIGATTDYDIRLTFSGFKQYISDVPSPRQ